jgi:acetyl/propionyl-CoA carboxylase alpha subunit
MIKAAAGGGGKGMRVVRTADELPRAFESASKEAESAFGDGSMYLEKFLERPRHIEIQVLADALGNVVHLGERE